MGKGWWALSSTINTELWRCASLTLPFTEIAFPEAATAAAEFGQETAYFGQETAYSEPLEVGRLTHAQGGTC